MTDERIKKLALVLVNHSITVKKGSIIQISCLPEAKDLGLECYKLCLQKGALPYLRVSLPGASYIYYKHASKEQLKAFPKIAAIEAEHSDGFISIGVEYNTKELTNIPPWKLALRGKTTRKVSDLIVDRNNWTICEFPTNALAQDAEMSLEEFEDFAYQAMLYDYKKLLKKERKYAALMQRGDKVRIVGENTDLSFSIKGKKWITSYGERNIPDGEIFSEPRKYSVNGYIAYTYPTIMDGKEIDGIRLEFKNGKVVKATAEKNEDFLKKMLKADKGASYLGEFGIGMNYNIKRFIKQILFDEKIGGTIHLALGRAYKLTGGENKSSVHWDMIKDLRKGGSIYLDGRVVYKKGRFVV